MFLSDFKCSKEQDKNPVRTWMVRNLEFRKNKGINALEKRIFYHHGYSFRPGGCKPPFVWPGRHTPDQSGLFPGG